MPCTRSFTHQPIQKNGIALFEVLITLIVFAVGMLGVFSMQIASKKTNYEAAQRSEATLLANDILQRIQNSGMSHDDIKTHYFDNISGTYKPVSATRVIVNSQDTLPSVTDCYSNSCTATQVAMFDLSQWHRVIKGSDINAVDDTNTKISGAVVPGLAKAIGCLLITDSKMVQVSVVWRAMSPVKRDGSNLANSDSACVHPDLNNTALGDTEAKRREFLREVVVKTYL
jgi:type IV pilus modification protein PilV